MPSTSSNKVSARCAIGPITPRVCAAHTTTRRSGTGERESAKDPGTPWGDAQTADEVAPGISSVTCAGHGGYKLSPERNKMIPPSLRNASGWYEEDNEWAKVGSDVPGGARR